MAVSTCWLTCCNTTVAGRGALSTYGGSSKEGRRVGVVVMVVLLLVVVLRLTREDVAAAVSFFVGVVAMVVVVVMRSVLVLLRTRGGEEVDAAAFWSSSLTVASPFAMAARPWRLVDDVSVVVVEVAKALAWPRMMNERDEVEEAGGWGGWKAAVLCRQQEETQAQASSKGRVQKALVVVVVILWLCLCAYVVRIANWEGMHLTSPPLSIFLAGPH